jgi:hypothetical protein
MESCELKRFECLAITDVSRHEREIVKHECAVADGELASHVVIGQVEFLSVDLDRERLSCHPFLLRAGASDAPSSWAVSARAA